VLEVVGVAVEASRELIDDGTYGFWDRARTGASTARPAFRAGASG